MGQAVVSALLLIAFLGLLAPQVTDWAAHVSRYRECRKEYQSEGLTWGEVWRDTR